MFFFIMRMMFIKSWVKLLVGFNINELVNVKLLFLIGYWNNWVKFSVLEVFVCVFIFVFF